MSEELFDVVHVGSGSDELGCAGPAEGVRGDGRVDLYAGGGAADRAQQALVSYALATVNEQGTLCWIAQQE